MRTETAGDRRSGGLAFAWLLLALSACFSPDQPPCAFSCAEPPHLCPEHYSCGEDRLCYREGTNPALCNLTPPDAGTTTTDAGAD